MGQGAGLTLSWAARPITILKYVSTGSSTATSLSLPGPPIPLATLDYAQHPPNYPMKGSEVLMPEVATLIGQCEGSSTEQPPKGTESL